LDAEKSAAKLAQTRRLGAGRPERQTRYDDKRRNGTMNQVSSHEILPLC
jgi:hypothetical protein